MTNPPPPGSYPPPPGNYPPPGSYPPPPGSYLPPGNYPQGTGYPPLGWAVAPNAVGAWPMQAYTPWINRVAATLIDGAPPFVVYLFVMLIGAVSQSDGATAVLLLLFWLGSMGYWVWNYGYRQGVTGSSIGKSVLKFKVVSEATGQPIGFGLSVVRQLAHVIDALTCYIGYLFPLWDAKRQTLADKIMTTVCLPTI